MENYKSELQLQAKCYKWFFNTYPQYRIEGEKKTTRSLLYHNLLNARNKIEASKLLGAGLCKGVPDMFLAVPSNGKHGLYIELKNENNKPEKHQLEVMDALRRQGYAVEWTNYEQGFKNIIENYLSTEDDENSHLYSKL